MLGSLTCDTSKSTFTIVFLHLLPANQDRKWVLRPDWPGEAGESVEAARNLDGVSVDLAPGGVCLPLPPPQKNKAPAATAVDQHLFTG